MKTVISKDAVLFYPNYLQEIEVYTDSSKFQLGVVITQNNRMLAFFSITLNKAQQKYNVAKQELLAIVETLEDFKGMLWGQHITMYADHKISCRMLKGSPLIKFTAGDYSWRNMAPPSCT